MKFKKLALLSAFSLAAFVVAGQSANAQGRRDGMSGRNDRSWSHGTSGRGSEFRHGRDGGGYGHREFSGGHRRYGHGYGYGYGYRAPYVYAPPYYAYAPGPYVVDDYYPDAYYYSGAPYRRYRTERVYVAFPSPHFVLRRILDPLGIFQGHHRHFGR